jgi:hypothetical protein
VWRRKSSKYIRVSIVRACLLRRPNKWLSSDLEVLFESLHYYILQAVCEPLPGQPEQGGDDEQAGPLRHPAGRREGQEDEEQGRRQVCRHQATREGACVLLPPPPLPSILLLYSYRYSSVYFLLFPLPCCCCTCACVQGVLLTIQVLPPAQLKNVMFVFISSLFSLPLSFSTRIDTFLCPAVAVCCTCACVQGVLLTIQGLPPAQLKNVMFVFIPLESDGIFEIAARFMGVDMERVIIDIQVRNFEVYCICFSRYAEVICMTS